MSEQQGQGPQFSPDDIRRQLEEMSRELAPGMTATAIEAIAGIHAQWYFAWQAAGIPEHRAAEWAETMIEALFRTGP